MSNTVNKLSDDERAFLITTVPNGRTLHCVSVDDQDRIATRDNFFLNQHQLFGEKYADPVSQAQKIDWVGIDYQDAQPGDWKSRAVIGCVLHRTDPDTGALSERHIFRLDDHYQVDEIACRLKIIGVDVRRKVAYPGTDQWSLVNRFSAGSVSPDGLLEAFADRHDCRPPPAKNFDDGTFWLDEADEVHPKDRSVTFTAGSSEPITMRWSEVCKLAGRGELVGNINADTTEPTELVTVSVTTACWIGDFERELRAKELACMVHSKPVREHRFPRVDVMAAAKRKGLEGKDTLAAVQVYMKERLYLDDAMIATAAILATEDGGAGPVLVVQTCPARQIDVTFPLSSPYQSGERNKALVAALSRVTDTPFINHFDGWKPFSSERQDGDRMTVIGGEILDFDGLECSDLDLRMFDMHESRPVTTTAVVSLTPRGLIEQQIAALPAMPMPEQIEVIAEKIAKAALSATDAGFVWSLLEPKVKKVGIGKRVFDQAVKKCKPKQEGWGLSETSQRLVKFFSTEIGKDFQMPPVHLGSYEIISDGEQGWFGFSGDDGDRPAATVFQIDGVMKEIDNGDRRRIRISARQTKGVWTTFELAAEDVSNTQKLAATFMAHGVALDAGAGVALISRWVGCSANKAGPRVYHRSGWRDDGDKPVFLSITGEVIPAAPLVELSKSSVLRAAPRAGSLEAWRAASHALYRAKGYDVQHLAALVGWAGTVVDFAEIPNCSYEIEGESGAGKSSWEQVGAAHWGDPDIQGGGLFISSKSTNNAIEGRLVRSSGGSLFIDEVRHKLTLELADLIYFHEAGVEKLRQTKELELRKQRTWRSCLVMSTEKSLVSRMRDENIPIEAGMGVRLMSISVDEKPKPPPEVWSQFMEMKSNYGWSGPAFVQSIQSQGWTRQAVVDRLDELAKELTPGGTTQQRRAARMAAILRFSGELAIEGGLIPVGFDLRGLIERTWTESQSGALSAADPAERAAQDILGRLYAYKGSRLIAELEGDGRQEVWGYTDKSVQIAGEGTINVWVIRANRFCELANSNVSAKRLYKALKEIEALVTDARGYSTWSGFAGAGRDQYVVLRESAIIMDGDNRHPQGGGVAELRSSKTGFGPGEI